MTSWDLLSIAIEETEIVELREKTTKEQQKNNKRATKEQNGIEVVSFQQIQSVFPDYWGNKKY